GIIYDDQKLYVKALDYYLRSLELNEQIGFRNGIANSLNNIGVVYENLNDYEKSLSYHLRALGMFEELGHKKGYAASLNNIGTVYLHLGDYEKANDYLFRSLGVAREIETRDLEVEIYEKLSRLSAEQGDYARALDFYKLYSAIKDSIFTKEKIEKIAGMQTTYEVEHLLEQQENEIKFLKKDNEIFKLVVEKQRLVKWRLYSILLVLFAFAFLFWYRYRLKYKANIMLQEQVEKKTRDLSRSYENLKQEIIEKKRIQSQLIRSERLAGVGELAAGLAHEIRNPLGNISSSAQFCLSKFEMDSELKRYFRIILEDSEKANAIIKGLLDFANPREMKLTKNRLSNHMINVVKGVEARCHEKFIKVDMQYLKQEPEIFTDKKWIEQALQNFILNAIQSMPQGGLLSIREVYSSSEKELRLIITDSGVGITGENLKKIFDPFFTTKEDGVGLGLSLAHKIIDDHKGVIQLESVPGRGTSVTLIFRVEK
ncbi:MAG: tetratricopeptide repeat protein, partial [Candidatus Cloacimonetes bacterium]|nr:tetratricopeptide repeat protein [Candidatus Cloacimonadota bacterium]